MVETRKKWDQYQKEAKHGPFVIELDDADDIVINEPDSEILMDLAEIPQHEVRRILRTLTQGEYDRVYELIRHAPVETLNELLKDIMDHFGYDVQLPGGSRASSS